MSGWISPFFQLSSMLNAVRLEAVAEAAQGACLCAVMCSVEHGDVIRIGLWLHKHSSAKVNCRISKVLLYMHWNSELLQTQVGCTSERKSERLPRLYIVDG